MSFDRVQLLVVDDHKPMRVLLRSVLRAAGFPHVHEAEDAAEALELMRKRTIDLIVTDLAMRPIDGIEFTTMLRRAPDSPNRYVTIIMMTGHSERYRVAQARDAGVNSFLVKPISARSLIAHVNAAVADPRPFIRSASYFGPDRRTGQDPFYTGPRRRASDVLEDFDIDC